MSESKTLFKSISALTLVQIANYAIPILLIPYISRIIGIEHYGTLEYARAFVLYFTILIDYGFNYTATRDISIFRDQPDTLKKIVSEVYLSKIILFLISTLLFYFFTVLDPNLSDISFVLWITYLINIGFVLFPLWFFQGIEKLAFIAYINFFVKLLIVSSVVLLLKEKEDYWVYNALQSLSQIVAGTIAVFLLVKRYHISFVTTGWKAIWQRIKSGGNVFVSTLLVAFFASYSFILLKASGTDLELGAYSTAFKLAITIQTIIILPFSQAFYPFMAKKAHEDLGVFFQYMKKAAGILIATNILILIVSFVFAEEIIGVLFGKDYLTAVEPFRILVFLPLFASITNLYSYQGLLNIKKDRVFLYLHLIFTVFTIISSHIIVPEYSLYGVVYLRVISEFLLMIFSYILFKKYFKVQVCSQ